MEPEKIMDYTEKSQDIPEKSQDVQKYILLEKSNFYL